MSDPGPLGLIVFLKVVMLNIKSKGYEAYSNIQAKVLPIPTTSATRLWGQNTFFEGGYVAYQIKGNEAWTMCK